MPLVDSDSWGSPGKWIYMKKEISWVYDPKVTSQIPPLYSLFAWYCRIVEVVTRDYVRGGEPVFRLVRWLTQIFSLRDTARLELEERTVFVDLLDPRFLKVIHEVRGSDTDLQVLSNLLNEGDTFIDVGANHGSFSITASHLVGSDGYIVAVEPQPRLSTLIRRSLEEGPSSFDVYQVALGDTAKEVPLYVPTTTSGSAGIYENFSATHTHRKITVPLWTFDEMVGWKQYPGQLVLKLDVEGSEIPFLEGASEMIRERHPELIRTYAVGHRFS